MISSVNVHGVTSVDVREVDVVDSGGCKYRGRRFTFRVSDTDFFEVYAFSSFGNEDALLLPHEKVAEVAEVAEVRS